MFIDIPKERQDLWKKFHPDNYPVWSYRKGEGDEYADCCHGVTFPTADVSSSYYQGGSFPITKEGRLKFGFRGRKVRVIFCRVHVTQRTQFDSRLLADFSSQISKITQPHQTRKSQV